MIKQVIVARKDLGMRKGKLAAQVAHASMAVFLDCIMNTMTVGDYEDFFYYTMQVTPEMHRWATEKFTKIVVGCDSEEELIDIYNKAKEEGLPCSIITDAGDTEFHGVPTKTTVAIGPDESEKIDVITKHLKLL
jgi:PTH2 family peptidyl-tRNA hydrolase